MIVISSVKNNCLAKFVINTNNFVTKTARNKENCKDFSVHESLFFHIFLIHLKKGSKSRKILNGRANYFNDF